MIVKVAFPFPLKRGKVIAQQSERGLMQGKNAHLVISSAARNPCVDGSQYILSLTFTVIDDSRG